MDHAIGENIWTSENIVNDIIIQEHKKDLEKISIKKKRLENWSGFLICISRMFICAGLSILFFGLAYKYNALFAAAINLIIISGVTNELIHLLNKKKDIQTAKYNEIVMILEKQVQCKKKQ